MGFPPPPARSTRPLGRSVAVGRNRPDFIAPVSTKEAACASCALRKLSAMATCADVMYWLSFMWRRLRLVVMGLGVKYPGMKPQRRCGSQEDQRECGTMGP